MNADLQKIATEAQTIAARIRAAKTCFEAVALVREATPILDRWAKEELRGCTAADFDATAEVVWDAIFDLPETMNAISGRLRLTKRGFHIEELEADHEQELLDAWSEVCMTGEPKQMLLFGMKVHPCGLVTRSRHPALHIFGKELPHEAL